MKVAIPHRLTLAEARKRVDELLTHLQRRHAHQVSDIEQWWEDNLMRFGFRAKGLKANGSIDVREREIIVEGSLPLIARPFEARIKAMIEKEAKSLLR